MLKYVNILSVNIENIFPNQNLILFIVKAWKI